MDKKFPLGREEYLIERVLLARQACFHDNVKSFDDVGGGVLGPRTLHLDFDILLELLLSDKRSHHDGSRRCLGSLDLSDKEKGVCDKA
ncbi:hypothetical protein Tco_0655914 [Tanacetum coccineum]|uniref:Uncharacterized protein n=1 Tax=Tanacetum coccineum TaxID=301880 RepID=A0ABQ4X7Y9_9ASTR